ncbi:hypothetical protein F5884DRAFT_251091 [Xylogone sp. PMI_703]|nr:hypothetical protein F5884DRAFT_251091 [Xylogone sp. PMI_703]
MSNSKSTSKSKSVSTPSPTQPTSWIPLTTVFTPPATCTENRLTMLSSPGFFIWDNEPIPVPTSTVNDCYPPEFLQNYTSIPSFSRGSTIIPASSIVPAMSPLICPEAWATVFTQDAYIACCPSGYSLHPPDSAPTDRPAYGGTCFSDFTVNQVAQVTAYNNASVTGTIAFTATTTPVQAFAHLIDGFALAPPTATSSPTQPPHSTTGTPSASSSTTAVPSSSSSHTGAIVGGVVGGVGGAGLLLGAALMYLRRRKRAAKMAQGHDRHSSTADSASAAFMHDYPKDIKKDQNNNMQNPQGQQVMELDTHYTPELAGTATSVELP